MLACMFSACSSKTEGDVATIYFAREDFKQVTQLNNPETISLEDMLNPASFRILNDTLLIVGNQDNCENLIEVYSLNSLRPKLKAVHKGSGPGEMLSCSLCLNYSDSRSFYLQDTSSKRYYTINVDSLLSSGKLNLTEWFTYSSEALETVDICPVNTSAYIAYNMWYSPDNSFDNGVPCELSYYKCNEDSGRGIGDFAYFVAPVNGARLIYLPSQHEIWAADIHSDKISVYNDSIQLTKKWIGPDKLCPEYAENSGDMPFSMVAFSGDKEFRGYTDFFVTSQHIYLLYEGSEDFQMDNLSPVEVFKLDMNGNLLVDYKLDRYINSISVDSSETYLYGGVRTSLMDPPELVRYKIDK
jgi:hypothetical protein